jgi:[ribosomal protein S18]-alanine N-acetyltransferase
MSVLSVIAYERRYRHEVLELLRENYHVHVHLDWYTTEWWLDRGLAPIMLAWQNHKLVGVIGASEPLHGTCWLRVVGVQDHAPTSTVLTALWTSLTRALRVLQVQSVHLLVASEWLSRYTQLFGMEHDETIITLRRRNDELPDAYPLPISVTTAEIEDLPVITHVDQAAFHPPWQLSLSDLRQAYRGSEVCTIARMQDSGSVVGYQLSTRHRESGHLARLAVLPEMQNRGVGRALLKHLIVTFYDRGVRAMTVNTQESNTQSQHLYETYGFRRNGFNMYVWSTALARS